MKVRVRETALYLRRVKTRIPFRYGKAVVTGQPYVHVRATVEVDGRAQTGVSAAALPPLWFDKDPSKTHEQQIDQLIRSVRTASEVHAAADADTAWNTHRSCEHAALRRLHELNELSAGFGVALMDAAVIDALCRAQETTFHAALRADLLGFGPLPLPDAALQSIFVRHTVGMADPITAADAAMRGADGLPETLEEVVRAYRVKYFKVKISGDTRASLERLRRIAAVLDREAKDYRVTLDGNEQFSRIEEVVEFVRRLVEDGSLRDLWSRTLWIEQPIDRKHALEEAVSGPLREIARQKPVIIDESDGTDDAVDRALALGYGGVSAKNCKGVYRTLHSFRRARETGAILSSEDLMNIPIVPLHQDLAVAAALGIPHSERNGHHYIRAFRFFSPREREDALREFPSLYAPGPENLPVLRIEDGALDLRDINAHAFGVRSEPDWTHLNPAG